MQPLQQQQEDVDDDKTSKQKKRIRRKQLQTTNNNNNNNGGPSFPTSVVCHSGDAASQPGAIELGVLLSLLVLVIYFFGFYETVMSLPDVPAPPNFAAHMGENLNLALNDFDSYLDHGLLRGRKKKKDKKAQKKNKATKESKHSTKKEPPVAAAVGAIEIPQSKWPVSINDDLYDFENIIHSGDGKTKMWVPKFWSGPIHDKKLMSRETAMKIGTCIEPDEHGNYQRGDKCPLHQRTIFIAIASYRDFQCRQTVESAFSRAKYPERIRFGIVDQIVKGEDAVCDEPMEPCDKNPNQGVCKYKDRVDVFQMDAELSVGPVFARHIGYRLYRGEYYATQSDAHVTFTQDWDVDIISQIEATHNEMAVLSTYLTDVQGSIDKDGHSLRHTRPIMCNTHFEGGPQGLHLRHGSQPEAPPSVHGIPQLSPWWAAGYSFSRGHFVVNVPYDPISAMIFQGEEMSIGIRGFTVGYDFYAPERSVCFHHYAVGKNAKIRNKVHHFWENDDKYKGTGRKSMQRLLGIVHMNPEVDTTTWDHTEEDIYGLGGVRSPEKFYETYGIDVHKKTAEDHLCQFVDTGGKMHKMFTPHLRKDGMGIDYSRIDYKFKDPMAKQGGQEEKKGDDEGEDEGDEEDEGGEDEGEGEN